MNDKQLKQILLQLGVFDKIYDIMRFVDPLAKKVFTYGNENFTELEAHCFDFWGKGTICNNCISMRAYNENQTFVKVEYRPNEIYMITAIPIELNNRIVVIELLKNTTDSMVFENRK